MPSMSKKISTNFYRAILGENFIEKLGNQGLGTVGGLLKGNQKKPGIDVNSLFPLKGRVFIGVLALSYLLYKNIEAQIDGATSDIPSRIERVMMGAKAFGFGIALVVSLVALIIPAIPIGITMVILSFKNDESPGDRLSTGANKSVANQVSQYRSDIISNAENTIAKKLGLDANPANSMDVKLNKLLQAQTELRKAQIAAQSVARHKQSAATRKAMTEKWSLFNKPKPRKSGAKKNQEQRRERNPYRNQ